VTPGELLAQDVPAHPPPGGARLLDPSRRTRPDARRGRPGPRRRVVAAGSAATRRRRTLPRSNSAARTTGSPRSGERAHARARRRWFRLGRSTTRSAVDYRSRTAGARPLTSTPSTRTSAPCGGLTTALNSHLPGNPADPNEPRRRSAPTSTTDFARLRGELCHANASLRRRPRFSPGLPPLCASHRSRAPAPHRPDVEGFLRSLLALTRRFADDDRAASCTGRSHRSGPRTRSSSAGRAGG